MGRLRRRRGERWFSSHPLGINRCQPGSLPPAWEGGDCREPLQYSHVHTQAHIHSHTRACAAPLRTLVPRRGLLGCRCPALMLPPPLAHHLLTCPCCPGVEASSPTRGGLEPLTDRTVPWVRLQAPEHSATQNDRTDTRARFYRLSVHGVWGGAGLAEDLIY